MQVLSVVKAEEVDELPFSAQVVSRNLRLEDLEIAEDGGDFRSVTEQDAQRLQGHVLIRFESKEARKALPQFRTIGIAAYCPRLQGA